MIRIKADRCGYDKYKCVGIPQISEDSNGMFDENVAIVASMKAEFNKLPMRIKGMVFSEDTTNMSWPDGGPHPEVPELTCRTNTDPLSDDTDVSVHPVCLDVVISGHTYQYPVYGGTSGWADLFNAEYQHGEDPQYFYRNTVVGSTNAVASDVFIITGDTHWHNIYSLGGLSSGHNGVPNFTVDITDTMENSIEMGPGLLEPMLDTDFDPVDISTIPAWEAGDDAFTLNNILINGWKGVVDDRFRNIYARLNNIPVAATDYNLRDLKREEYENTDCQNFRINLSAGESLQTRDNQVTNTYTVTDGQIAVDEHIVYVSGDVFTVEPAVEYPIYVWVRVYETDSTDETTTAEIVLLDDSYSIGDELSGGEVIAKEQISVPGSVYRYKYTVQFDDGRKYTGLLFFGFPLPDADDHVVVVGGVRKVFGGTSNDSFVLFKIFQTECSPVMNFASDAEMGLHGVIDFDINGNEIITPLPGSTVTPAPGIVQPVVNIALVVDGSTETNTQSTTDVPTVEAVYNFIHGITAYNGPVADAKATEIELSGISGSTVFGEPVDYVIPINKDRWAQNTEDEISGYTAAASMYEAAKAAWELAGEPTEGEIYEAYIEASTIYSDAYYTVYGDVSDGEPGTTYVINNIVLMNGDMMGVTATTAPSVRAVYNFVHDIYALSTPGTVDDTVTPHEASSGTPGTVYTVDTLDISAYTSGTYYADQVPTVKAVMDYVKLEGATAAVAGKIVEGASAGTEAVVPIPPGTEYSAGTVQPVRNIWVGDISSRSASIADVPTAEAVYNFVHGFTTGSVSVELPVADAMASLAEMSHTDVEHEAEGDTPAWTETITNISDGAYPGVVFVVNSIDATGGTTANKWVPNVGAFIRYTYNFVHSRSRNGEWTQSLATAGTTSITGTSVTEDGGTPGTVIPVGNIEVTGGSTAPDVIPTAQAVVDYVGKNKAINALHGVITVTDGTEGISAYATTNSATEDPGYEDGEVLPSGVTISGITTKTEDGTTTWYWTETDKQPAYGLVQPVINILEGSQNPNSQSPKDVPTVKAVIDYIHGYTNADYQIASAKATAGTMSVTLTVSGGTPGTVDVVDNIETTIVDGHTITAAYYVPTAQAVVTYIEKLNLAGSTAAVAGALETYQTGEAWVDGSTETQGTVWVGTNIVRNSTPSLASYAVPTIQAVYDFVHTGSTVGAYQALATPGYMYHSENITPDTTEIVDGQEITVAGSTIIEPAITGGVPGTTLVVYTIDVNGGTAPNLCWVPTAGAVVRYLYDFVHSTETGELRQALATIGNMYQSGDSMVLGNAVPGTMYVSNDIVLTTGGTITAPNCVPTAQAVVNYMTTYVIPLAVAGTVSISGTGASQSEVLGGTTSGRATVARNIELITDQAKRTASTLTVPTLEAVYNFVKGQTIYRSGDATGVTLSTADSSAPFTAMTHTPAGTGTTESVSHSGDLGTCRVASDIVVIGGNTTADNCVPSAQAVVTYITGMTITAGTSFTVSGNSEAWSTTPAYGLVQVANVVDAAPLVGGDRSVSGHAVPTVAAVVDYVATHATPMTDAVLGSLTVNTTGETISNIGQTTASSGAVQTVDNIVLHSNTNSQSYSPYVVPSVKAVYNFIHSTATDTTSKLQQALATGSTMTAGASSVSCASTPGTVYLATDIKVATNSTTLTAQNVVPTAQAVVDWVATHGGSGAEAIVGRITTSGTTENFVTATTASTAPTLGSVYVSENVNYASSHTWSCKVVPTVLAVSNYVQAYVHSDYALASNSIPGTVYVTSTILGSTTYGSYWVPSVEAVKAYISGSSVGGGVPFPSYGSLGNYHSSGSLTPGTSYTATGSGWLMIANWSASCGSVTIDGTQIGLGNAVSGGGMAWFLPIRSGQTFTANIASGVVKFDGGVSGGSSSAKSGETLTKGLLRTVGVSKYDPEDESTLEETEESILDQYRESYADGGEGELATIRNLMVSTEDSKNEVAERCKTMTAHNKETVTMSYRCERCTDYVYEMCSSASSCYNTAATSTDKTAAAEALAEGDSYAEKADTWLGNANDYVTSIYNLHNKDTKADYLTDARTSADEATEYRDAVIEENEKLIIIGITGGSTYVENAERAAREAEEWYTSATIESANAVEVYTSAYAIASNSYIGALDYYERIAQQGNEARVYVNGLEKSAER